MKTQNETLTDIFQIISTSPVSSEITGEAYKKVRPNDSELEDCVISLISGNNAKFLQDGAIYVKIFYKDIFDGNTYRENATRNQILEGLLWDLSEILLHLNDYSFEVQSREIYSENVAEIWQHFVILKMNFKLTIH